MIKRLILLVQAIFTFFVGLLLASQGLPTDEADMQLRVTGQVLTSLENIHPEATPIIKPFNESLVILGLGISFASALEFFGVLLSVFVSIYK